MDSMEIISNVMSAYRRIFLSSMSQPHITKETVPVVSDGDKFRASFLRLRSQQETRQRQAIHFLLFVS